MGGPGSNASNSNIYYHRYISFIFLSAWLMFEAVKQQFDLEAAGLEPFKLGASSLQTSLVEPGGSKDADNEALNSQTSGKK